MAVCRFLEEVDKIVVLHLIHLGACGSRLYRGAVLLPQ
jgi:hypothetical protein